MGAQRLSPRSTRRIIRDTGLDIIRAWGNGGYTMSFVTRDHRHGFWDKKTGEWGMETGDDYPLAHFSTCKYIDPDQPSGYGPGGE